MQFRPFQYSVSEPDRSSSSSGADISTPVSTQARLLVVIASYGAGHEEYLRRLVEEYRSMSYQVHIVVTSNLQKPVPEGVEVVMGMPTSDPWSLPFAHKKILAERLEQYDLFIYSEDDTLATEQNIEAFLRVSKELPKTEIPGFIRYERLSDGTVNFCDVNGHFHWDPGSVVRRGPFTFAYFTNEHAAFYLLTQEQLRSAIQSGGFLVPPHRGKYDLACTASTDPYTQCGFRKLVCISHLDEFSIHHLPNRYVGTRFGTHESDLRKQINALMHMGQNGSWSGTLFPAETRLQDASYSKDYYEPVRTEVVREIPAHARNVLSIGCGSGATEKWLASRGAQVTAVCLDSVIASCAQHEGVETICGDFSWVKSKLAGRKYDCLLMSNLLHLVPNPEEVLREFAGLLHSTGSCVMLVPNLGHVRIVIAKLRGDEAYCGVGDYKESGTRDVRLSHIRKWLAYGNLGIQQATYLLPESKRRLSQLTMGLVDPFLAKELLVVAQKRS